MKKTVGFFAAAVLGTMMMSMPVSADQTINNGATGSTTDTADMTVTGIVGAMDNTDPNENIPDGDARWINVTLPTSALFNSNPATSNATLMAPDYAIGAAVKIMDRFFRHRKVPLHRKIFKTQISA